MADAAPASRGGFKQGFGGSAGGAGGASGGRGRGKNFLMFLKTIWVLQLISFFKEGVAEEVEVVVVEEEETKKEIRRNGFQ